MAEFNCPKCISPIVVSEKIDDTVKAQAAAIVRKSGSRIRATETLKKTGADLSECKGIVLHITSSKGECHHCKTKLEATEGNCPKCRRLNFDW